MKKQFIAAALIAALGLTACGEAKTSEKTSEKATEATKAAEVTTEATTEAATTAEITTEAATEAAVPTELSKTYADLDNRSFKYNGKLMTLGVSTLQDFLDAGLEPKDNYDKMWTKKYNGNPRESGKTFDCSISTKSGYSTSIYFCNPTGSNLSMKECVLCMISYRGFESDIQEGNYTNSIEFSFPCTLKSEELTENSGEPTVKSDYGYEYTVVSEKFPECDTGYKFGFKYLIGTETTEIGLDSVEITWAP
ncbi:hypothetical protein [Ruminococcus flavefaciens]|uniref:hypothetical protein n=1 Tax=Ruminococcus flavefaciens TaxID=1265 RepID=UPI0026EC1E6E|nr:hypothetical protein [Ruminococcus flavefaciens]